MARGWESKSIEQQQDEARAAQEPKQRLTSRQREEEARKTGLKLSRSRILEQIRATENPNYRRTLEKSLAALDEEIERLG
jgi:hypothetical protein